VSSVGYADENNNNLSNKRHSMPDYSPERAKVKEMRITHSAVSNRKQKEADLKRERSQRSSSIPGVNSSLPATGHASKVSGQPKKNAQAVRMTDIRQTAA